MNEFGVNGAEVNGSGSGEWVDIVVVTDAVTDNQQLFSDSITASEIMPLDYGLIIADIANMMDAHRLEFVESVAQAAAFGEVLEADTLTLMFQSAVFGDALESQADTSGSLISEAGMHDLVLLAFDQIVSDLANGTDTLSMAAALALVDIAQAATTHDNTYVSVLLVAELIAATEALNTADGFDITDAASFVETLAHRVDALVALIESALATDVWTAVLAIYQPATDTGVASEASVATGVLNALLADGAVATIRLNIGGELFTGWVLNADSLAASEYQFADLQFNSACKHGSTYLLAADDGVYQFTEDTGVETVMTYIKTGKMDFGSDMRKSVTNAYMVYSASGQMALRVTTSVNGALQTYTYGMAPFAAVDTPDPQRVTVGKGLKSRYWQFELTGENAGCKFDEIGMLPVVLSRRI